MENRFKNEFLSVFFVIKNHFYDILNNEKIIEIISIVKPL